MPWMAMSSSVRMKPACELNTAVEGECRGAGGAGGGGGGGPEAGEEGDRGSGVPVLAASRGVRSEVGMSSCATVLELERASELERAEEWCASSSSSSSAHFRSLFSPCLFDGSTATMTCSQKARSRKSSTASFPRLSLPLDRSRRRGDAGQGTDLVMQSSATAHSASLLDLGLLRLALALAVLGLALGRQRRRVDLARLLVLLLDAALDDPDDVLLAAALVVVALDLDLLLDDDTRRRRRRRRVGRLLLALDERAQVVDAAALLLLGDDALRLAQEGLEGRVGGGRRRRGRDGAQVLDLRAGEGACGVSESEGRCERESGGAPSCRRRQGGP